MCIVLFVWLIMCHVLKVGSQGLFNRHDVPESLIRLAGRIQQNAQESSAADDRQSREQNQQSPDGQAVHESPFLQARYGRRVSLSTLRSLWL